MPVPGPAFPKFPGSVVVITNTKSWLRAKTSGADNGKKDATVEVSTSDFDAKCLASNSLIILIVSGYCRALAQESGT